MSEKAFNQIKEGLEEALAVAQGPEVDVATDALLDRIEAGGLIAGILSKGVQGYELYCQTGWTPFDPDAFKAFQELEARFKGGKIVAEKLAEHFINTGGFFQEPPEIEA
ncbi:MAG: hypothetical protein P1U50_01140 [Parvibaculaceae bacterium]|nr:hypothetical protein [Parvibaculaceae bacterium]